MSKNKTSPNSPSFIVFSDDWGEHPSSCQHIFKYIGQEHKVLWINTIGMRNPTFSIRDTKKIIIKTKKMFKKDTKARDSSIPPFLTVCQPAMLPFSNIDVIRKFNKYSVVRSIINILKANHIDSPFFITTVPNACDYVGYFNENRVVFYCVDDFSEWPGLNKTLVQSMENELIKKADIFIASSNKLFNKLKLHNKPTHLLTHGIDIDFFKKSPLKEHPLLANIPRPRVGYSGLFDDRSDKDLLKNVAMNSPKVSFVITGKVETDISSLKKLDNFYFTGPVPYEELPAMIRGWDICMLPYKVNELTNAIQPLKFKEYLASAKPVISTPIEEAKGLKKFVIIGKSVGEWCEHIKRLLSLKTHRSEGILLHFLEQEDWRKKANYFLALSLENLV